MKTPKITAALFCNATSPGDAGKIDCRGVFTTFLAWGFPTVVRNWQAVVTVYGLPAGSSVVAVAVSRGRGEKSELARLGVNTGAEDLGTTLAIPLVHRFAEPGFHTFHFEVADTKASLRVPLKVTPRPWPTFTKKELQRLTASPGIVRSVRANIVCAGCSRPYVFEEAVLPDHEFADGVIPFPDSGVFTCQSCEHELHVRDIQGQIRNSIKTAVGAAMKVGR